METPEEYLARLRSIGVVGKNAGKPRVGVTRTETATVIETEHWDGRQDATVRPDVIRHGARVHGSGSKKGEVAEIRKLTNKEKRDRYGE